MVCPVEGRPGRVLVVLSAPGGPARFTVDAAALAGFLAETFRVVPAGAELDAVDVDAELAELLAGGAR